MIRTLNQMVLLALVVVLRLAADTLHLMVEVVLPLLAMDLVVAEVMTHQEVGAVPGVETEINPRHNQRRKRSHEILLVVMVAAVLRPVQAQMMMTMVIRHELLPRVVGILFPARTSTA